MNRLRFLAAGLLLTITHCAAPKADPTPQFGTVPDDINDRFKDPELDPDRWVDRWEAESREIYASRDEIIEALELRPGMRVADIGAGTGIFIEPLSKGVGRRGRVYALDIAPRFVDHIRDRARREGLSSVEAILSGENAATLPRRSVDLVIVCDTYHHFSQPQTMLSSIRRALRPGGRLVIIDFERIPGQSREWVLSHVRAGKEEFRAEIEAAGFDYLDEVEIDGFRENYLIRFERP